jgi:signal transduction histidine kinase
MGSQPHKMKMLWFILAGVGVGLLLIHPVIMLAYAMSHRSPGTPLTILYVLHELRHAFGPGVVHMGVIFAIVGGVAGWMVWSWFRQKKQLEEERVACLRDLTALNTLKELTVTLAHYIRNANMVVGGFSDHLLKAIPDPKLQEQLRLIHQASEEIDAVMASLQNLTEISTVEYTASSHEKMIDLKKDLEARLARVQPSVEPKPD